MLLATVSIDEPVQETIARVYEYAPPTIEDLPCFIIFMPAREPVRGSSLLITTYTVRLELLVRDADIPRAQELADAYAEAMLAVFHADLTLNHTCTLITGPKIEEAGDLEYPRGSGQHYVGFNAFLTVQIQEPKAFS